MQSRSFIRNIFPPPKYITLPNIGVDISDSSLKYVQFARKRVNDEHLQIQQWGDIPVPDGIVERGNVHDVRKLTDVLKEVRETCRAEYVRMSLPEERAYLFETTIKRGTPFKEIRGLIEFKLEENVPLSPREAYFDYEIVDSHLSEGNIRVVVAVYARDTINSYYEACVGAGLMPLSFEIEASAIARASIPPRANGTHMIVDFGQTRTGIGIVHEGALMYASTVEVGGADLNVALRTVLGDVPEEELTVLKNTKGIAVKEGNKKVYDALHGSLASIVEALEARMQYWYARESDEEERGVGKLILCGGSANLAGLQDYLATKLQVSVECAEVWQNALSLKDTVPQIPLRQSYGYATAIGLALRDFVNHERS